MLDEWDRMELKVTKVVKADTFEVFPPWRWKDQSGIKVRIADIETPSEGEVGYERARERLKSVVEGKNVELKNMKEVDFDRLVCNVYVNGKNVAQSITMK